MHHLLSSPSSSFSPPTLAPLLRQLPPLSYWADSASALSSRIDTDATACCSNRVACAETAALAAHVAGAAELDADAGEELLAAKKIASSCGLGACLEICTTLVLFVTSSPPA